jgi:cyclic pyranopterin phosphate synthase
MPEEGLTWLRREELLSFEEIVRVAGICVTRFGFDGIRLTGGEPTVRRGIVDLVAMLRPLGVDLAMTTNGASLDRLAQPLRAAGLRRINISLDSLRPERVADITRRDVLDKVLAGIDAALVAGFDPVKVNVVLMRGVNDDEALDFARFGREKGVQVRFIEFMPLDADGGWSRDKVVSADDTLAAIDAVYPLEGFVHDVEPATRYRYLDGAGEIGVVPSVTRPFCGDCDRIRLTADGQIRSCLFALDEHDVRPPLRSGGTDNDVAAVIEGAVGRKWAGHRIGQVTFIRPSRSMSQIGG